MRRPLATAVAVALTLVDCHGGRHPARPEIGVTLPSGGGEFYRELERGMRQAGDSLGLDLHIVSGDAARQAAQVDSFMARRAAAIVIAAADPTGVAGAAERAGRARVPVFTVAVPTDDGEIVSHIGSDDRQAGEVVGRYVAQRLHGGGNVAVLDRPTVPDVRDRVTGFRLALASFPNIRIVATPAVDPGTRHEARRRADNLLATDQRIDAIFGTTDEDALGALAAIQAAGRKDVIVVGYGATPEARAAIRAGAIFVADAAPDPFTIGRYASAVVASHLRGNRVAARVPVRVRLVDRDSLEQR